MNSSENINSAVSNFDKELIVDGMFDTERLNVGEVLVIDSGHHKYKVEKREDGLYVSGHEEYCPEPIKVDILAIGPEGPVTTGKVWTGRHVRFLGKDVTFLIKGVKSIERNP
jgi:hypothetical protein